MIYLVVARQLYIMITMFGKKTILIFILLNTITRSVEAATITGTIWARGPKPALRPIATSADAHCRGEVYPEVYIIGEHGELANVLVHLKSGVPNKKYPPPSKPIVLNQVGCRYVPHVFAGMIGQQVVFMTSDPTLHTVDFHAKKNPKFAVSMPQHYRGGAKTFDQEEFMIPIMCSVHPWMLAFGNILRHPFFFVSEPNGRYLIRDVPVGTYTIEAWHEKLGRITKDVEIQHTDEFQTIDFTYILK